jgi:ribosomal-protein-alanine N-acetyltransferase
MKNHPAVIQHPFAEDIRTERLDLIAITPEAVLCEKSGGAHLRIRLGTLVAAEVTHEWPPKDWEPHVLDFLLQQMADAPQSVGWARFVALRGESGRILIGTVGAVPPGSAMDHAAPAEIEVGYGILPAYQRHGYATEALAGLLPWVRSQAQVAAFVAQTFPHLQPSIRVLEKSGFYLTGAGFEEGTILFRKSTTDSPPPE